MNPLKKVFKQALSRTMLVDPGKRFIFLYHDISDPDAPHHSELYSTRIAVFREQIAFLAKHFRLVSLEEIVSENSNGKGRLASVTFDDGFHSVKEVALPHLSAKGIPFAVFINSMATRQNRLANGRDDATVNGRSDRKVFLDEDDIKYLSGQGVIIGSHTSTHRILSECNDEQLKEEVLGNKLYIEGLLGKEVRHMAIPFGKREHYNEHVLEFCHAVGHDYVYSTNPSYFTFTNPPSERRLIPRIPFLNESKEGMLFYINRPMFKRIDI